MESLFECLEIQSQEKGLEKLLENKQYSYLFIFVTDANFSLAF